MSETAYPADLSLPKHSHDRPYFCFVLEGGFAESLGSETVRCESSTLVFHPISTVHSNHFSSYTRCLNVLLDDIHLTNILERSPLLGSPRIVANVRLRSILHSLYREFNCPDGYSALSIEGLLLETWAEISRNSPSSHAGRHPALWLRRARGILDEIFDERISLIEISALVGVHPVHLAKEFRRVFQTSVGEYVRQRRVDHARNQLACTDLPLSEIALESGFFDQSHFSRTFKKVTGLTPGEYRSVFTKVS